ncbi:uncharacterized protein LOC132274026 [Cornus florida]|uniref:uncharacterized protein LOC132274026 n=1 Tax=Cornus florida TaxID=4283 RepID=UPI00289D40C1|nr:uncharacterized protein LOC132274026 [Cornus florida]
MEKGKKHPTLPPNYVTLAQLQERWLNEQQRKQREKQEEEREWKRNQGEKKEEQERKRREKENQRRNENGGKRRTNSVSVGSQWQFQRNFRSQAEKSRRRVEVTETRMEESKIGGVNCQEQNGGKSMMKKKNNVTMWERKRSSRAQEDLAPSTAQLPPENEAEESEIGGVNCQEQNGGKSMKKKKNKKKYKMKRRSRAQEHLAPSTAQLPPENEAEEKVSVVVTETNGEEEKTGSEIRPNGKNLPVYRKVSENEPEEEIPVVVTEINGEKEKRGCEFRPNVPVYDVKVSEKETEEEIPVVLAERNGEKEGVRSNFRSNRKGLRVYGKVWEQKGLLDGSAEIRSNFNNLSLNGGKESNQRLTAEMNGGHRNYNRGFEGFNRWNTGKPIDASLVWVRKGETSDADADADAAKTQSSGSLVKGWKGKNPIR